MKEDELRQTAFWSWREHTPTKTIGKSRMPVPFDEFWDKLIGKPMEIVLPDMEKIEKIMKAAR